MTVAPYSMDSAKQLIADVEARNRLFYSDARGHGALKDLQQSFPHAWIYVAELIQNAVDAGAKAIRFVEVESSVLVLEHDGKEFDALDVEGLCTKGVSSKGAGTVGFMGVGFKAVFRSFQTVVISSGPWRFRLHVAVVTGEKYGDCQRDWLGAVTPRWADGVSSPSSGMTCRFEFHDRDANLEQISDDFDSVFRGDSGLLALLAMQGIQRVQLLNDRWELRRQQLSVPGASKVARYLIDARDESENTQRAWMLFRSKYTPSHDAVRRFLEHRAIRPLPHDQERVYAEASRERLVDLFFPLDAAGFPDLPENGEAFALLPTAQELPIGAHINADWLLTVTRTEFMDIGGATNSWQEEIRDQVPSLIADYCDWLGSASRKGDWHKAYRIFPEVGRHEGLAGWLCRKEMLSIVALQLADIAFLPRFDDEGDAPSVMLTPTNGRVLPGPLESMFNGKPQLVPGFLFGEGIIDSGQLGARALAFLGRYDLLVTLTGEELARRWGAGGVAAWAEKIPAKDRDTLLCGLFRAITQIGPTWGCRQLVCLPTETGSYVSVELARLLPPDWNILVNEPAIRASVEPFLKSRELTVRWTFDELVRRGGDVWSQLGVARPSLVDIVEEWWAHLPDRQLSDEQVTSVVSFTCWVLEKQRGRRALVRRLLASDADGALRLLPCKSTLLADPYAGNYRRLLFPNVPVIADQYLRRQPNDSSWRALFEDGGTDLQPQGRALLLLRHSRLEVEEASKTFKNIPGRRASWCQAKWPKCEDISVDSRSYVHVDVALPQQIQALVPQLAQRAVSAAVDSWVSENTAGIKTWARQLLLYIPYGGNCVMEYDVGRPAEWVDVLACHAWVFAKDGSGPHRPQDTILASDDTRPDAHVADLSPVVLAVLKEVGVPFGANVPHAGSIRTLHMRGPKLSMAELNAVFDDCMADARRDPAMRAQLRSLLETLPLVAAPLGASLVDGALRVSLMRCVRSAGFGRRSDLGWAVDVSSIARDPAAAEVFRKAGEILQIPEQISGSQCMDFLSWVWRTRPEADRVRQRLPMAFDYIAQDLPLHTDLAAKWDGLMSHAHVYTLGRQWVPLSGEAPVFYDDLGPGIGSFVPKSQLATPGHLGDKAQGVKLLKLRRLSEAYRLEVEEGAEHPCPEEWARRLHALRAALLRIAQAAGGCEDQDDEGAVLRLRRVDRITRRIVDTRTADVEDEKEIGAIVSADGDVVVAGQPEDFAADLCPLLLESASVPGGLSDDLGKQTSVLLAILDGPRFVERLCKLCCRYGVAEEMVGTGGPSASSEGDLGDGISAAVAAAGADADGDVVQGDTSGETCRGESSLGDAGDSDEDAVQDEGIAEEAVSAAEDDSGGDGEGRILQSRRARGLRKHRDPDAVGENEDNRGGCIGGGADGRRLERRGGGGTGSHRAEDRERLLAHLLQQAERLKACALVPEANAADPKESSNEPPADATYRLAVLQYELRHGRFPHPKADLEEGHDIDSYDSPDESRNRNLVRRIEVKGRRHAWTDAETVELSRAQFENADKRVVEEGVPMDADFDYWLYVVERNGDGKYHVLPIRNPSRSAAKYEVRGGTWRSFAEEAADVSIPAESTNIPESNERTDVAEPTSAGRIPGRRSIRDVKGRQ